MKQYRTLVELYLTFLTHNDSYMKKVPVGTILALRNGELEYEGKTSIDNEVGLLYQGYIEEIGKVVQPGMLAVVRSDEEPKGQEFDSAILPPK